MICLHSSHILIACSTPKKKSKKRKEKDAGSDCSDSEVDKDRKRRKTGDDDDDSDVAMDAKPENPNDFDNFRICDETKKILRDAGRSELFPVQVGACLNLKSSTLLLTACSQPPSTTCSMARTS